MSGRYIARHPMTASRELGAEMIVISASDSRLFTLNEVGASIWKAADGQKTVQEIVDRVVCGEFEIASGVAATDVETFVDELVRQGILLQSDGPIPRETGTP